jgi:23S rRNA (guanosine2251-2'-O)-methyltransferase
MTESNVIFGMRAVIEALKSDQIIEKVLVKTGLQGELFNELKRTLKDNNVPFQLVPVERIQRVTTKNHQGVVALVSPVSYQDVEAVVQKKIESGERSVVLVLDGITDVRNFGAIARTAECAGVTAIVIPEKGSAPVNGDAIKTSAGALFRIPVCRVSRLWYTMKFLKSHNFTIVAASEKAGVNYRQVDYAGPIALVLGAEDTGISSQVMKMVDQQVAIPVKSEIGSLNVSVAAGILIYEIMK